MNAQQKIFVGVFTVFVWVIALITHHLYADIDVTQMITLCQAVLIGLGVTHLVTASVAESTAVPAPPAPPPDTTTITK